MAEPKVLAPAFDRGANDLIETVVDPVSSMPAEATRAGTTVLPYIFEALPARQNHRSADRRWAELCGTAAPAVTVRGINPGTPAPRSTSCHLLGRFPFVDRI